MTTLWQSMYSWFCFSIFNCG